jgi:hypothetical protein
MREQEVRELYEAYKQVHTHQEEVEQLDELSFDTYRAAAKERNKRVGDASEAGRDDDAMSGQDKLDRTKRLRAKAKNKAEQANEEFEQVDEDANYDRNRKRAAQRAAARNEARRQGKTGSVPGVGYVSPRPERETYTDSAGVERHKSGARMPQKEETDLFDYILEYLIAEGYADTNEDAFVIMANMSEEWRESIVEELEQLDEISLKTKISAAARRGTDDFESGEDATTKSGKSKFDKTLSHIEKRHGAEAARHAVAATDANTFGRTDKRTGKRQERPQSRTQRPNQYRTRADGKMHGQDQAKLKRKLQNRRPSDSDN